MKFEPLTEIEANAYQIIGEYLKRNKETDLQVLIPHCLKSLEKKYSQDAIAHAVNNLIRKRYFIQGSILTRDEIIQNPVRKRLLLYIQVNPGAYNRLLRRDLNLGSNEFNWHIGMLERFGFIKKFFFNDKNFAYFENRDYMGHEFDLYLLRNEKTAEIIKYLEKAGSSVSFSQISRDLGMHYSTVQKHMELLINREYVKSIEQNGHVSYTLNDDLLVKLRKIVNGQVFIEFAEPLSYIK